MTRIYLAGPDVFLAEAEAIGRAKKDRCAAHGFIGVFPLDADLASPAATRVSTCIYEACVDALLESDVVVANLTPFRGISADVGTVFEVAYAIALRKPVFAYTNESADLMDRVAAKIGVLERDSPPQEQDFAADGMVVENFGLVDNLMIVEAIRAQGWDIVARAVPEDQRMTDLAGFEACLLQVRTLVDQRARPDAAT